MGIVFDPIFRGAIHLDSESVSSGAFSSSR